MRAISSSVGPCCAESVLFSCLERTCTYLSLGVDEVDEDELDGNPESVEESQVPVLGQVLPCYRVGLTTDSENGLNSDVHDHETFGTEGIGQDFESIGNKQTRPSERVEDTEDPDEWNLSVTSCRVGVAGVLVDGASDGPADE
jgi:hypothetical protein